MDPYKVLGIKKNASVQEIKSAFRKLVFQYHPDLNSKADCEDKFIEIIGAYNVLKNPELKKLYDKRGEIVLKREKIFSVFRKFKTTHPSGNSRTIESQNPDVVVYLKEKIEALLFERNRKLEYDVYKVCSECKGEGVSYIEKQRCPICKGSGSVVFAGYPEPFKADCHNCGGTGEFFIACKKCKGEGVVLKHIINEIILPAGLPANRRIRFKNCGHELKDKKGDLIVEYQLFSENFELSGYDLILKLEFPEIISELKGNLKLKVEEHSIKLENIHFTKNREYIFPGMGLKEFPYTPEKSKIGNLILKIC